jgi:hypothetical protein
MLKWKYREIEGLGGVLDSMGYRTISATNLVLEKYLTINLINRCRRG